MASQPDIDRVTYWKTQIRRTSILLLVWFIAGYVMSIFLAEPLNAISFGGVPFGFWMAQQGSIFVFISLILIYAVTSDRLDEEAGVSEDDGSTSQAGQAH
jgi:putative solute:sodium symporter small subunit